MLLALARYNYIVNNIFILWEDTLDLLLAWMKQQLLTGKLQLGLKWEKVDELTGRTVIRPSWQLRAIKQWLTQCQLVTTEYLFHCITVLSTSQTDKQLPLNYCIPRRCRQQLCEQLVKFPNLTPLIKMDSPYSHYFPTCHPSANGLSHAQRWCAERGCHWYANCLMNMHYANEWTDRQTWWSRTHNYSHSWTVIVDIEGNGGSKTCCWPVQLPRPPDHPAVIGHPQQAILRLASTPGRVRWPAADYIL